MGGPANTADIFFVYPRCHREESTLAHGADLHCLRLAQRWLESEAVKGNPLDVQTSKTCLKFTQVVGQTSNPMWTKLCPALPLSRSLGRDEPLNSSKCGLGSLTHMVSLVPGRVEFNVAAMRIESGKKQQPTHTHAQAHRATGLFQPTCSHHGTSATGWARCRGDHQTSCCSASSSTP